MDKKHEHGDYAYNKYAEIAGIWLVCSKCGKDEFLPLHCAGHELGWEFNICPDCK